MGEITWSFGADDGSVTLHTGVTGRAARTGHRLTIVMKQWSGTAISRGDEILSLDATIVVDSLAVVSGEGGLTPLTGAEKMVARSNALKSLRADKYPEIAYESTSISKSADGYRAEGTLTIDGQSRSHDLEFTAESDDGRWAVTAESVVSHREFGVKPYSLMMGALKVADEVRVVIDLSVTTPD